jgi:hypothetical protein
VDFRKGAVRQRISCMGTGTSFRGRLWWSPAVHTPGVSLANDHRVTMQKQILFPWALCHNHREFPEYLLCFHQIFTVAAE